jgi:hypothetical protein
MHKCAYMSSLRISWTSLQTKQYKNPAPLSHVLGQVPPPHAKARRVRGSVGNELVIGCAVRIAFRVSRTICQTSS